jgi:hypothetical protein
MHQTGECAAALHVRSFLAGIMPCYAEPAPVARKHTDVSVLHDAARHTACTSATSTWLACSGNAVVAAAAGAQSQCTPALRAARRPQCKAQAGTPPT